MTCYVEVAIVANQTSSIGFYGWAGQQLSVLDSIYVGILIRL